MVKDDAMITNKAESEEKMHSQIKGRGCCRRGLAFLMVAPCLAGLVLSGCATKPAADDAPVVTVQVGAAENDAIQRKVTADATIYPLDQAAIVTKVAAPVKKFYVVRGSQVHAGQLLAELENQDLAGAVTENQGGVLQAEVGYQAAVQKAQQDLKLVKEQMDAAQRLYDNRQSLFRQGAASARDVSDAAVALTQVRNQYETAQKQLDLKAAEAQVTTAKGRNQSAEAQFNYSKIVSPIDGVVTDRPLYPGEMPASGAPFITVMNLSQIVARAHISQQEAAQLEAGDPATISIPGQVPEVRGKVTLVSPALDPNSNTVEVWVQAPNPGGRLKSGATARVTMVAQTVKNAIVAPAAALLTAPDGTTSVMMLDTDNKPHRKTVKVGIRDANNVQILDGLQKGDRVVTVGAFELDRMDEDVLPKVKVQVQAPQGVVLEEEDVGK
jgi:HlyD family secretion protein